MTPDQVRDEMHEGKTAEVRDALVRHRSLTVVEVDWSTGWMLCVRRA